MREWTVASAIVESPDGLLLVQNARRNGARDWSTPGGVIEIADGESILDGLTREVFEETGLTVRAWDGPVYRVETVAEGLGWRLQVEVHRAVEWHGDLVLDDHDQIVIDAAWVAPDACAPHIARSPQWVREPLLAWLADRTDLTQVYRYRVDGADRAAISVIRL